MAESYLTVLEDADTEYVVARSKFLSFSRHIEDADHALDILTAIRKQHSFATHVCYGYIADEEGREQRFSDDGEPKGTAGMPILEVVQKRNLKKTLVAVVRYFGGVKLGTGGLVRAYTQSAVMALDKSGVRELRQSLVATLVLDFEQAARFRTQTAKELSREFASMVTLTVAVPLALADSFRTEVENMFGGKVSPQFSPKPTML